MHGTTRVRLRYEDRHDDLTTNSEFFILSPKWHWMTVCCRHAGVATSDAIAFLGIWPTSIVLKLFPVIINHLVFFINFTSVSRVSKYIDIHHVQTHKLIEFPELSPTKKCDFISGYRWHHAGVGTPNPVEICSWVSWPRYKFLMIMQF